MKAFFLLLAGVMAGRDAWLILAGKSRRWFLLVFWLCLGLLVVTRERMHGWTICVVALFLGWLLLRSNPLLVVLWQLGLRLGFSHLVLPLSRRVVLSVMCAVRGRPLLVIYRDHPPLSDLVETLLLPQVADRAMVVKNWVPRSQLRHAWLERLAMESVGDPGGLPVLIRFRGLFNDRRYDLRKALWMCRNGLPEYLEDLVRSAHEGHAAP